MPTVPSLDPSQQVTPNQAPDVQSTSAVTAGLLDQGAQQMSDAGNALGQASDVQSQIAIDAQNRINQTRVDAANNQVQAAAYSLKYDPTSGYTNKTGAAAITPDANGVLPADAAVSKLNDTAQSVRGQLTPEQQRQFDISYGTFSTNFAGEALAHEGQQTKQYSLDTNNSAIQLAQAAAAQDYSNPGLLDNHVVSAGNAAYKSAQVMGLQGDALTQTVKQSETSAIMAGYNAAVAKGDFNSASAIQSKYGSFLTADAAVEVDRQQTVINNNQLAIAAASRANVGSQVASSPAGQAFAANVQVESAGKQSNADGTPVTSSKGAVGIAQVLPATAQETAEKHGIAWDPARFASDPTYNRLIGQTYWQDQLAANNGDVSKADAAYNGSPGALQAAVAKATAAGTPNAWLQYMAPETQAYVPKVAAVRQGGVAPATMPTKLDVVNAVTQDPSLQNNPVAMKAAIEIASQRWEAGQEAVKQTRAQALASAQTTLAATRGDLSQIPPATLAAIDPGKIPELQTYAKDIREGGVTTNPALYADVVTNMQKYTALSDAQWLAIAQPNLSLKDFKSLTTQRAEAINSVPSNGPGNVNMSALNATLDQRLVTMGLDPHPKITGVLPETDAASRVDALRTFVTQNVFEAQRQANRKFSQDEVASQIDHTLAQTSTTTGLTWYGAPDSTTKTLPLMDVSDIPDAAQAKLKADFKAQGVANPTPGQMLGGYWHMQTQNKAQASRQSAAQAQSQQAQAAKNATDDTAYKQSWSDAQTKADRDSTPGHEVTVMFPAD